MKLNDEELQLVRGGAWYHIAGAIAGALTFCIGIIDGFFRPLACNR